MLSLFILSILKENPKEILALNFKDISDLIYYIFQLLLRLYSTILNC